MIREDKCSCFRTLAALLLVSVIFFESVSPAQEHQRGIIAKGSIWETEYYVIDGEKPGPVVMIVGGIHGNEPAGCRAVEQIRHWNITRGELIVLPRANRPSLQRRTR
ncbi:MAG: hypothetical protein ACYS67_09110, partial [Planctomycetota bacterium]